MKAVFLEDYGHCAIRQIPEPELTPGHALVRIKSVSICGSDVNAYLGRGTPVSLPLILGHEICGIIEAIPPENEYGLQAGDRVLLDPYMNCGNCYPCSLGRRNCCQSLKVLGVQTDGAMRQYVTHPLSHIVKLNPAIPWETAPLAEPLTISLHALHRAAVSPGEHVAITGAGPIGLMAALAAKHRYAAEPILIDIVDARLEYARSLGIRHTVNPASEDAVSSISKITQGKMAEAVVEASGANSAIRSALDYASYCGRVALTGWPSSETPLPTYQITRKELSILGSRNSVGEFPEAIELIASKAVDASAVLTQTVDFDQIPDMIGQIAAHPEKYLKVSALLD